MNELKFTFILLCFVSCQGKNPEKEQSSPDTLKTVEKNTNKIEEYCKENKENDLPSNSTGTVSNGKLENGKLMPFQGANFQYFDTLSYTSSRAFVNNKVKQAVIDTYKELQKELPGRKFFIMECSNKNGGKIFPHRTHQNGLSIDFMMPMVKNGKPYYGLDTIGSSHYWLDFDNNGKYLGDKNVSIDFDLVAQHIITLDKHARKNGLKISKVIIKTELRDELYSSPYGKNLKNSYIYVVKSLTPLINSLHDDHYHIDFEKLN